MDSNATNVVRVGLKHVHTLQGIIVEHTDLHIILPTGEKKEDILFKYCLKQMSSTMTQPKAHHGLPKLNTFKLVLSL